MPDAVDSHVSAFRAAGERRDLEALLGTMTPDVAIHSPVSARLRFEGIEQAQELFRIVLARLDEIHYYEELGDEGSRVLFYRGRLAGAARSRGFGAVRTDVMALFGSALRVAIAIADRIGARLLG
jgi:hypothetical protein